MENKKNESLAGQEMNFFDLCVVCGRAIGRAFAAFGRLLGRMCRLTYHYWWIVLPLVILAAAAALYNTRRDNTIYKLNAVALLNGPSIQQFEQAYAPLRSLQLLPPDAAIAPYMAKSIATGFTTYRVVDCLNDGVEDYVDFKQKVSPTDTVKVLMKDRLCLQFRLKARDMHHVPAIESALLELLNSNDAMQQSYKTYLVDLREEVIFNHTQAQKLDSLTTHYYFYSPSGMEPDVRVGAGVNFYGDRRIRLFLDEIYEQHEHLQLKDYRYQLATAPVVLENHFAVDPAPVNNRWKMLFTFLILGWAVGCVLAELIDKRKQIIAWLKQ